MWTTALNVVVTLIVVAMAAAAGVSMEEVPDRDLAANVPGRAIYESVTETEIVAVSGGGEVAAVHGATAVAD